MSKDTTANTLNYEGRSLLERASLELVRLGDNRGLITLVEQWCVTDVVPTPILISEVRALLDFKLMDRAWVRLRELSERIPDDLDVVCLTCEMFIGRGWPARAENLLKPMVSVGGYPEIVDDLFLRSQRTAISPPRNSRDIERTGSVAERLALAECFMATGAHLRARSVLERVLHDAAEGVGRAEELLWGLDAGFDNEKQSLLERARQITGEELLGGMGAINLDNLQSEMTSEVTATGDGEESSDSGDPSFPSLFRSVETDDEEEGVAEATKVTSLSSLLSEEPLDTMEHTVGDGLDDAEDDGFDDTRVMVVVSQASGDGDNPGVYDDSANKEFDEFDAYDLDDSELGIGVGLEGEDADIIVLTNDESNNFPEKEGAREHAPMRVVEAQEPNLSQQESEATPPDTTPEQLQTSAQKTGSGLEVSSGSRQPASSPSRKLQRQPVLQSSLTLRKMLQITLVVAILCVTFVGYASNKKHHAQAEAVVSEIIAALSGTDATWRGTSAAFERRVSNGFDPTSRNELGFVLLHIIRWSESGNVEDSLESIEASLVELEDDLSGSVEYSLALAEFSFAIGDYDGLSVLLNELDNTGWAEVKHLRSESSLQENNLAAARIFASEAVSLSPDSVRYLMALGRICSLEGDAVCVESVSDTISRIAPGSTYATLMDIAGTERPLSDSRLNDVLRQSTPRESSQSLLWFAQLAGDTGVVDQAVDMALGLDPENGDARYLKGVRRIGQGEISGAEMDFTVCMNVMPASFECQFGLALSQFEQDHVDEAADWIMGEEGFVAKYGLNPTLLGWLQVEQGATISSVVDVGPYRAYLRALDERDGAAMLIASDELLEHGGVINDFLGARGLARAARFGVDQPGVADRAYALAPLDPVVLTDLAWLWDSVGYERRSSLMFRLALERGSESAYTLFERGRFFLDLGDNFRTTRDAWLQYRDLSPTGPRSEERMSNLERLR